MEKFRTEHWKAGSVSSQFSFKKAIKLLIVMLNKEIESMRIYAMAKHIVRTIDICRTECRQLLMERIKRTEVVQV